MQVTKVQEMEIKLKIKIKIKIKMKVTKNNVLLEVTVKLSSPAVLHETILQSHSWSVVASTTLTHITELEHAHLERIDYE